MSVYKAFKYVDGIHSTYGKSLYELDRTPPQGYEFTGEFRSPLQNEEFLTDGLTVIKAPSSTMFESCPRLILRKKETVAKKKDVINECAELLAKQATKSIQAEWDKQTAPKTYTAAEVKEKFGESVMAVFGYPHLKDLPGFAFTGKIEHPRKDQWFVAGHSIAIPMRSIFDHHSTSYLTLIKLPDPTPRIITFTKMAAADFLEEEAAYLPAANGELIAVNRNEVEEEFYYERREVA